MKTYNALDNINAAKNLREQLVQEKLDVLSAISYEFSLQGDNQEEETDTIKKQQAHVKVISDLLDLLLTYGAHHDQFPW